RDIILNKAERLLWLPLQSNVGKQLRKLVNEKGTVPGNPGHFKLSSTDYWGGGWRCRCSTTRTGTGSWITRGRTLRTRMTSGEVDADTCRSGVRADQRGHGCDLARLARVQVLPVRVGYAVPRPQGCQR